MTDDDEEENARERWLTSLSSSLLGDGKKSFLDAVSKCLSSGKSELVRVCLTTVAWLSFSLASLHDTKYQLSAFSALISPLKQYLQYGVLVEQRILASLSLLNFSTIPGQPLFLVNIKFCCHKIGKDICILNVMKSSSCRLKCLCFVSRMPDLADEDW